MKQIKPTYNALIRRIERLEACLKAAHVEQQRARLAYTETLHELVEIKMRSKQAAAILNGEDA